MTEVPTQGPFREQLDALVRTVVTGNEDLNGALTSIAQMGRAAIDGCTGASVTLYEDGKPKTVAFTDGLSVDLDQAQYDARTGPCLEAIKTNQTLRVHSLLADARWQHFTDTATDRGVRSSLSMPLNVGGQTFGGLNLYGDEEGSFDEEDEEIGELFASYAASVIANVAAYWSAQELTEHLQLAISTAPPSSRPRAS